MDRRPFVDLFPEYLNKTRPELGLKPKTAAEAFQQWHGFENARLDREINSTDPVVSANAVRFAGYMAAIDHVRAEVAEVAAMINAPAFVAGTTEDDAQSPTPRLVGEDPDGSIEDGDAGDSSVVVNR